MKSRRAFLRDSGVVVAGCCLGACGGTSLATPNILAESFSVESRAITVDLTLAALPVGGAARIADPALSDTMIIVRVSEQEYAVLSIFCTHRSGNELVYESGSLRCNGCDGATYDIYGNTTGGPWRDDLRSYEVSVEDQTLRIAI